MAKKPVKKEETIRRLLNAIMSIIFALEGLKPGDQLNDELRLAATERIFDLIRIFNPTKQDVATMVMRGGTDNMEIYEPLIKFSVTKTFIKKAIDKIPWAESSWLDNIALPKKKK